MKNTVLLSVACILVLLVISGCAVQDDTAYEKIKYLESRIEILESQVSENNRTETVVTTNTVFEENIDDAEFIVPEETAVTTTAERSTVFIPFPDGCTVEDVILILTDSGLASRSDLIRVINEYDFDFEFLEGIDELNGRYYRLEGYLMPGVYQFYTDSNAEEIIRSMLKNFEHNLEYAVGDDLDVMLENLGMTLDEVVEQNEAAPQ